MHFMGYSRQNLVLGKNNLSKKTAAIIGLGAIGSNSANLLARAGLNLILIDKDAVESSNINSQNIYTKKDLNKPKASVLAEYLKKISKNIKHHNLNLKSNNISIIKSDLVLDCTDNMETKFLLNDYCKRNSIPLLHSAAIKTIGTIFVVNKGPCLRCIYKNITMLEDCNSAGILNTTASLIASIQCSEALKILTNKKYEKALLRINLANNEITKIKINKNCPLCTKTRMTKMEPNLIIKKCKDKGGYSVRQEPLKNLSLNKIKKYFKVLIETPIVLVIKGKYEIIVHNYGELIFKNTKEKDIKEIEKISQKIYKHG